MHHTKFLYNTTKQIYQFPKFTSAWNSTCFGQFLCSSSGIYSQYTRHWYMSYRFVDSFRAGPGWSLLIGRSDTLYVLVLLSGIFVLWTVNFGVFTAKRASCFVESTYILKEYFGPLALLSHIGPELSPIGNTITFCSSSNEFIRLIACLFTHPAPSVFL